MNVSLRPLSGHSPRRIAGSAIRGFQENAICRISKILLSLADANFLL
jgi:hypothetical protein